MFEMRVSELHLAAYMKAKGAVLIKVEKSGFWFTTDKSESVWRLEHSNSCCCRVDMELINLRKFIKG